MVDESSERAPFKSWFDAGLVDELGAMLKRSGGRRFDRARFVSGCEGLDGLEMSGRVGLIADAIRAAFSGGTRELMAMITGALPERLEGESEVAGKGYRFWPLGELIARHGLDDVDASFEAMVELTMRFSSEFAVRPFLEQDVDGILERMERLVEHPNKHVRRWLSEGTRSRLPWGRKVKALAGAQDRRLALLTRLRHDAERYVQRSIANHLGDILKDDVSVGIEVLRAWMAEADGRGPDRSEGLAWIVRHAARGPLKAGHPEVMALFGVDAKTVAARVFKASPKVVSVGDTVELGCEIVNTGEQAVRCRVDWALLSPTKAKAAKETSRKVFRWADRELEAGERSALTTRYAFVPRTIRAVRPGVHGFELVVNGQVLARASVKVVPGQEG